VQSCAFSIYPDYPDVSFFDAKKLEFQSLELSDGRVSLDIGGGEAAFLILKPF